MEIHHDRHHKTYVDNLNKFEDVLAKQLADGDVAGQISTQNLINFNGGGDINHTLFWKSLQPKSQGGGQLDSGVLRDAISKDFGSLDKLKELLNTRLAGIQGSGWGWLGYDKVTDTLAVLTTANQDPLLCTSPACDPADLQRTSPFSASMLYVDATGCS